MNRRITISACAVYLIGAILAFGHAAAHTSDPCIGVKPGDCFTDRTGTAGANGMMAAMFWPLYLSWELQE